MATLAGASPAARIRTLLPGGFGAAAALQHDRRLRTVAGVGLFGAAHRSALGGVRMMCGEGGDTAVAELEAAITAQGGKVRDLKTAEPKDKAAIGAAVAELLALKARLPSAEPPKAPVVAPPPPKKKAGGGGKKGGAAAPAVDAEADLSEDELFQRRVAKASAISASGAEPYAYT